MYFFNDVQKIKEFKLCKQNIDFPTELFKWGKVYLPPYRFKAKKFKSKDLYLNIHRDSKLIGNADISRKLVDEKQYQYDIINSTNKSCLIQSYEDQPLDIINTINKQTVGDSRNRFNILIIRDVRNMIASRLQHKNINTLMNQKIIKLWKKYAYEALGYSNVLNSTPVVIYFDQWVSSIKYRQYVSSQLNLAFSDCGFKNYTLFGGGSSFNDLDLDLARLTKRYLDYSSDKNYMKYFKDMELYLLNDTLMNQFTHIF